MKIFSTNTVTKNDAYRNRGPWARHDCNPQYIFQLSLSVPSAGLIDAVYTQGDKIADFLSDSEFLAAVPYERSSIEGKTSFHHIQGTKLV